MTTFGRQRKFGFLPRWVRERIEVNWIEPSRLLEEAKAQIEEGAYVLDAGSGEGRYKELFGHTRYVGLDLAVGDLAWDYSGLDSVGDLRLIPFADNSFDAVISIQTFEHLADPFQVAREIGRVLKPGGRFYLSAPMNWHQHQKPHDYFRYTSFGFQRLIEEGGLEMLELRPNGGYFRFLSYILQDFHYWFFPPIEKRWQWWLQLPFQAVVQGLSFVLLPLVLYYLDRLDKSKDQTLGWVCIAQKSNPREP